MDVSWSVEHVEELPGLGSGHKEWIVATRPFLALVEPHGGTLDMPAGVLNRAVEIQGEMGEFKYAQAREDELTVKSTQPLHATLIEGPELTRERRHRGKPGQTNDASHQGIISVVVESPKTRKAKQDMDNQEQNEFRSPVTAFPIEVLKAALEAGLEIQVSKQPLEHDEAGIGGQGLVTREPNFRETRRLALDSGSANLHCE